MTNRFRRVFLVTTAAVALAGCSTGETDGPASPSVQSPATDADVNWSNVWSANRGIDLFSRGGELVRATVEAGYLAQVRGDNRSFPGYATAIGPQQFDYGDARREAKNYGYAAEGMKPRDPGLTAIYYHIVDLAEGAAKVSATVCGYGLSADVSDAGKYLHNSFSVSLVKPVGGSGGAAGVVDNGSNLPGRPGTVPTWNVFAPWMITQIQFAQPEEVPASCTTWWKSVFPDAVKEPDNNQMIRPRGGPPAPDVVQYPKWIGPSNYQ